MSVAHLSCVVRTSTRSSFWRRRLIARSCLPRAAALAVPCRTFAASSGGRKSNTEKASEQSDDGGEAESTVSRLFLPAALGAVGAMFAVSYALGSSRLAALREQATRELQQGCPEIPAGAMQALAEAPVREFETNRLRVEVEWHGETAGQWRLEVHACRSSALVAWQVTSLKAFRASATSLGAGLAPQTRQWKADARGPVRWQEVWQSGR